MTWPLIVATLLLPTVGLLAFRAWLRRLPGLTTQERIASWDVFLKGFSALSAVAAGLFGVLQYLDTRRRELEQQANALAQQTREFNIRLYDQADDKYAYNFKIFNEAVDVAATLAAADSLEEPEARIARRRFERLYWGQMSIMESMGSGRTRPVERTMIAFRDALVEWERTGRLALDLAHACGDALVELSTSGSPKSLPISPEVKDGATPH